VIGNEGQDAVAGLLDPPLGEGVGQPIGQTEIGLE
jgi:hypothetical protein